MGPPSNDKCPHKRQNRRHKHRRGGHVKVKGETGETWPQVKEGLKPPEAGKGRK